MAEREHPENFLDKGWSAMFLICEHASICKGKNCYYIQAVPGTEPILGARCDRASGTFVNIIEAAILDEDDPNYRFKMRKKDGL